MAETTPQKRVLPARERADSSAKRRAVSPATQPTTPATEPRQKRKYTKRGTLNKVTTPAARTPGSATPTEEILPTKIQVSKTLPTSSQKQPDALSNKEYQSIAESAVLAASLHRSRMQWLCDGVFKRYWTKPVKRKGVIEQPPGNPDAKSMSKLGNATMTIEPHVFDVVFYTVKDLSSISTPYYRHPNQHTAKQPHLSSAPKAPQPPPPPSNANKAPPGPSKTNSSATTTVSAQTTDTIVKQETPTKSTTPKQSDSVNTAPVQRPVAHPPTQSIAPSSATSAPSRPATDPVIQMLAARAATDNRLKELMKVVATSQASHEQLKEFQAHIDEFNEIIKQQEAKKAESEKPKQSAASSSGAAHPATYSAPSRPHPGPPTSIGGPMHMAPSTYPAYPPPRPEPFIKHIVIEFHSTEASTDRWLFPEYAVLDIRSGGMEMIASFFVVRTGEEIRKQQSGDSETEGTLSQKFKPNLEYYQPVTALIKATQHRTIETIARAAKSLSDCRKYMEEVMGTKTRAPQEYLVHRLPRDKLIADTSLAEFVDSAVEMSQDEDDELKDDYGL